AGPHRVSATGRAPGLAYGHPQAAKRTSWFWAHVWVHHVLPERDCADPAGRAGADGRLHDLGGFRARRAEPPCAWIVPAVIWCLVPGRIDQSGVWIYHCVDVGAL